MHTYKQKSCLSCVLRVKKNNERERRPYYYNMLNVILVINIQIKLKAKSSALWWVAYITHYKPIFDPQRLLQLLIYVILRFIN